MSALPNLYYHPEQWGLETIAELEYSSGGYEFDTRVVWCDKETGELYTARDSGCSCPTPFEDYVERSELDRLTRSEIEAEVRYEFSNDGRHYVTLADIQGFFRAIDAKVKRHCPECNMLNVFRKNDYICEECRNG